MLLDEGQLQAGLDELVAKHRVPGAVCAMWHAGRMSAAATGTANLNTGEPMTVDTGYLTGSITKVVLATIIMTLSFMALLVIPELKLSDLGLFDGAQFKFTELFS